jgi:hypothetical protein
VQERVKTYVPQEELYVNHELQGHREQFDSWPQTPSRFLKHSIKSVSKVNVKKLSEKISRLRIHRSSNEYSYEVLEKTLCILCPENFTSVPSTTFQTQLPVISGCFWL